MSDELARRACLFFLERLEAEVGRLGEEPFPGHHTGPRKWLRYISGVIQTAKGYLAQATLPSPAAPPADLVQNAEILAGLAYEWLSYVAGADARGIPHQVVAPFQRWVDSLGVRNTLFFRAEHLSNYELWTFDLEKFAQNVPSPHPDFLKASTEINWPVQRVTVPSQAMGMLPHFAVVAHELGHAIQDQIQPDLTAFDSDNDAFFVRVQDRLTKAKLPYGKNEKARCLEIADKWQNELKADAVGHTLAGPAFFFALAGFLELTNAGYGIAPTHPPSDLRLDALIVALAGGTPSFIEIADRVLGLKVNIPLLSPNLKTCPTPDPLFSELEQLYGSTDAAICVELVPYMKKIAPTIFEKAADLVAFLDADLPYTPPHFEADLGRHLALLVKLVPPIEYREGGTTKAATLASILNVGWAALLRELDKMPDIGNSSTGTIQAKMERLHQLLLKGVELSEAKRRWDEHAI